MASNLAIVNADLDHDAVQIIINGTSYQSWDSVDIDSDIMTPADSFQVSGDIPLASPSPAELRAGAPSSAFDDFREGQSCDVLVGSDRQMAGVIDEIRMNGSRQRSRMTIAGRDKGAFLIDGEAKHIEASKYTIKTLFEALLDKAWGIGKVLLSNEDNRKLMIGKRDKKAPRSSLPKWLQPLPRDRTKIDAGERVASIFDQRTRQAGITWWLTAKGDLFIGKPNYDQEVAYHFSAGASTESSTPTNIESWDLVRSVSERYSEIRVVGQGWADQKSLWTTSSAKPKYVGIARDPDLVERGIIRKLIISDCDVMSNDEAQQRADWEMGQRRLQALVIRITVAGFRQGDRLFATDTLATVKLEEANIDGTFYVMQRRFREDRQGQRTELTLHETKVWLP